MPDDYQVQAVGLDLIEKLEQSEFRETLEQFIAMLLNEGQRHQVGETFAYRWLQSPNGWARSLWMLEFYGKLEYFCTTCPVNLVP